jgi:hypothetical protein
MTNPLDKVIDFISHHRPSNPGSFVAPYLLVALTILLGLTIYQVAETRTFSTDLRDGLVKSCEKNGNPLREAVQTILQEQIEQSERTPRSFFPDIPPDVFDRLIEEQRERNEEIIERIEPVDCPALYP